MKTNKKYPSSEGIPLQKKYGQFFLRDSRVTNDMLEGLPLKNAAVFEIGCGDGFLTKAILSHPVARLDVFEIDPAWAGTVKALCKTDPRFKMHVTDFLQVTQEQLVAGAPWIVLSNLPYHLTFPILHKIKEFGDLVPAGAFMMQEEVAQKIVQTRGRGYGYVSLFFQYYFDWKLLSKVQPKSFFPEPKVFSRLISFKRKTGVIPIPEEKQFWRFIKLCFAHPRRTFRNNMSQTHINMDLFKDEILDLRSQQMSMQDFLKLWDMVRPEFIKQS